MHWKKNPCYLYAFTRFKWIAGLFLRYLGTQRWMFLFSLFCVISSQNEHKCFIHLIILIHFFAFLSVWSITMLVYRLRIRSTYFFKFSVLPQLNVKTNNFKNIVAAKEKKIRSCFIYRSHCCWIYIYISSIEHTPTNTRENILADEIVLPKKMISSLYTALKSHPIIWQNFLYVEKLLSNFLKLFKLIWPLWSEKSKKMFSPRNLTVYSMANANTTWTIHTGSSTMYLQ